jgi:tetratricopeptide (TPR) repeat protein
MGFGFRPLSTTIARAGWLAAVLAVALAGVSGGQEGGRIIDRDPFDRLTLDQANENKVLLLRPVDLPGRRVPEKPKLFEKLRVRMLEDDQEYEVAWQSVEKLELYEDMVLAETNQLAADGKFDEAYEYFTFLREYYPGTQGLAESQQTYLYLSAGAAFRQQKYDEALAIAEELLAQNPQYKAGENSPALLTVLGNIADKLIGDYAQQDDFRSARTLLSRLTRQYSAAGEPFAVRWREELTGRAAAQRDQARTHLDAGRFIEAYDATAAMRRIWPDVAGGQELEAEIARQFPRVEVGVEHPAADLDGRSLINPAARRAGRLVERNLLEFTGPGSDGGKYVCPVGSVEPTIDGLALEFVLRPDSGTTGQELARRLLGWAQPESFDFQPAWARTLDSVRASGVYRVTARLKTPHVLAAALLQRPLEPTPGVGQPGVRGNGPFFVHSRTDDETRFSATDRPNVPKPPLAEISERFYADPQRALLALSRGEIDLLERVFPGDIRELQSDPDLAVAAMTMPTSHLLVIRDRHPYLANRTFRRALLYGINRDLILQQGILKGNRLPGFQVTSAPFPAPSATGDSQSYAYDQQIAPRPYDPRLALTLRLVAERQLKSAYEKLEQQPPAYTPMLLGHPADETSRIACRAIVRQWEQIGVKCKLAEFPPGQFDDKGTCDLVYLQAATWEPLVDAGRLLGPEGAAPAQSAFIQLTLRQIERATNWQEARERFRQLHRLLHEDVTVLPLYQTHDYYAYRKSLQGLDSPRVTLYENIDQWQVTPRVAAIAAGDGRAAP